MKRSADTASAAARASRNTHRHAAPTRPRTAAAQHRSEHDPSHEIAAQLDRHGGKIHAVALRLCGNEADAADVLQETFLQARHSWHTFEGRSDAGTWLYAIAVRLCGRRSRRRFASDRRMPAFSQVAPWTETSISAAALKADTPLKAAERRESEAALQAAIVRLPEPFRLPLVLKEMLELPIDDVAAALDLKPATVATRVHRARLLLRKAMLANLPSRLAPRPVYEKRVCIDLLKAKLEAMDKGRGFPIGQDVICRRCQAVFRELDLVQDACSRLASGTLPASIRAAILRLVQA